MPQTGSRYVKNRPRLRHWGVPPHGEPCPTPHRKAPDDLISTRETAFQHGMALALAPYEMGLNLGAGSPLGS